MKGAELFLNREKSSLVGINIEQDRLIQQASHYCCRAENLPINYMGIPLGARYRGTAFWEQTVDKIRAKLDKWKNLLLSKGGRLTLASAILNSIPSYAFSVFKAPSKVINKTERLVRNFFLEWVSPSSPTPSGKLELYLPSKNLWRAGDWSS